MPRFSSPARFGHALRFALVERSNSRPAAHQHTGRQQPRVKPTPTRARIDSASSVLTRARSISSHPDRRQCGGSRRPVSSRSASYRVVPVPSHPRATQHATDLDARSLSSTTAATTDHHAPLFFSLSSFALRLPPTALFVLVSLFRFCLVLRYTLAHTLRFYLSLSLSGSRFLYFLYFLYFPYFLYFLPFVLYTSILFYPIFLSSSLLLLSMYATFSSSPS